MIETTDKALENAVECKSCDGTGVVPLGNSYDFDYEMCSICGGDGMSGNIPNTFSTWD